ncbi:MAG: hypothetical protein JWN96_1800 [Mycobacterium sp.]|nr:hypothetical protein [Mycobacterium sp.]
MALSIGRSDELTSQGNNRVQLSERAHVTSVCPFATVTPPVAVQRTATAWTADVSLAVRWSTGTRSSESAWQSGFQVRLGSRHGRPPCVQRSSKQNAPAGRGSHRRCAGLRQGRPGLDLERRFPDHRPRQQQPHRPSVRCVDDRLQLAGLLTDPEERLRKTDMNCAQDGRLCL